MRVLDDDSADDWTVALVLVLSERCDELLRAVGMKVVLLDECPHFPVRHRQRNFVAGIMRVDLADFFLVRVRDSFLVEIDDDDIALVDRIEALDILLGDVLVATRLDRRRQSDDVGEVLRFQECRALDRLELHDEHRDDAGCHDHRERGEGGAELDAKADELH